MLRLIITITILFCFTTCSSNYNELFKKTDAFVESLDTNYESYGVLGTAKYSKTTSDGLYKITPVGRLINVKIQKVVTDKEYEDLQENLKEHYENDQRINDVYICQGGTVMIDCRN